MNDLTATLEAAGPALDQPEDIASVETAKLILSAHPPVANIHTILAQRARLAGDFGDHATVSQRLKEALRGGEMWGKTSNIERESCEMIAHHLGQIASGDPHFKDHWLAIVDYAQLVADRLA